MTAREPSAVEVIAEADEAHRLITDRLGKACTCGQWSLLWHEIDHPEIQHRPHRAAATLAALKAAGFVVATRDEIRAMSVQEQAELVGGEARTALIDVADRTYATWRQMREHHAILLGEVQP